MTFIEFYQIVIDVFADKNHWEPPPAIGWLSGDKDNYEVEWCVGGASGGSCWGDESREYTSDDLESELDLLDILLEKVCPNMTLFQYRRLMKDLVEHTTRSENEYYGNYTNYRVKRVNYQKLYDKLIEEGIIH